MSLKTSSFPLREALLPQRDEDKGIKSSAVFATLSSLVRSTAHLVKGLWEESSIFPSVSTVWALVPGLARVHSRDWQCTPSSDKFTSFPQWMQVFLGVSLVTCTTWSSSKSVCNGLIKKVAELRYALSSWMQQPREPNGIGINGGAPDPPVLDFKTSLARCWNSN